MIDLEEFQVRGVSGSIKKVKFGVRIVDYWAPKNPGNHIIVAHDGQNILDKRNIGINPHQRATWRLAEAAVKVAAKNSLRAPTVICVYHTPYSQNKLGRLLEYTPSRYMKLKENWMIESYGLYDTPVETFVNSLNANELLSEITEKIVPSIATRLGQEISPENTAIIGASMGGLATIYSTIQRPDFFSTALSFSPHWVIGGEALAEKMMCDFPIPGKHKLWMSRGTKGLDASYESAQKLADKIIMSKGYVANRNLITRVLDKGAHSNASWARYTPAALDFWLGKGK